ncbi:hypothetical protein [Ferrovibrio sp.]|uniref:hypothetical protein n=1 Tax=Ferrovibrio sp. TaxID=1917215 RepID=UPI000CCA25FE|nr:hypothetical protein [Ferrovibrio sp.]PJI43809.1 MAG: hypothetical protein CTR53_02010 [Ferrovibrio sp.]
MTKNTFAVSLLSAIASVALFAAGPAQAGSRVIQPGATAQIDVAERGGYTTAVIVNSSSAAGSLQLPAGGRSTTVPANGRTELYDRYGNGPVGNSYIAVTNTGSVPLQVITRYAVRVQLP